MSDTGSAATRNRPAAEGLSPGHFPPSPVGVNHTAPVPRRIRGVLAGETVLDTSRATYVWEHPYYPQFYVPAADVRADLLADTGTTRETDQGRVALRDLVVGDTRRAAAARYLATAAVPGLDDTYRFSWGALDHWLEEDEEVFVHPRSPYTRVDAIRANRHVRVTKDGVLLAEADTAIAVFETGLPTRWYLDRTAIRWPHLRPSTTVTACPYKGVTSGWWDVVTPAGEHPDLLWGYDFPTRQLQPIAGLVAFYNDKVELTVDGLAA